MAGRCTTGKALRESCAAGEKGDGESKENSFHGRFLNSWNFDLGYAGGTRGANSWFRGLNKNDRRIEVVAVSRKGQKAKFRDGMWGLRVQKRQVRTLTGPILDPLKAFLVRPRLRPVGQAVRPSAASARWLDEPSRPSRGRSCQAERSGRQFYSIADPSAPGVPSTAAILLSTRAVLRQI